MPNQGTDRRVALGVARRPGLGRPIFSPPFFGLAFAWGAAFGRGVRSGLVGAVVGVGGGGSCGAWRGVGAAVWRGVRSGGGRRWRGGLSVVGQFGCTN